MLKAFKYRIYPNREQKRFLEKCFGTSRWTYNFGLQRKIEEYQKNKKTLGGYDILKEITQLKKKEEYKWLEEVGVRYIQASIYNLEQAFTNFFRKTSRFPKFKSKKKTRNNASSYLDVSINFEKKKIKIPKLKSKIKIVLSRTFNGKIKRATISKTETNKYFVSFCVETNEKKQEKKKLNYEKSVGIDVGVKALATLSDGRKIENIPVQISKKFEKKLKKAQRELSRKKEGSKNREKSKLKLNKIYEKITNKKNDFLHKETTKLVSDNQVDTFCLETLNIKNMIEEGSDKNKNIARAEQDSKIGTFVSLLCYKAEWAGKNILFIGKYEPSSKICNKCGSIKSDLKISDRTWTCSKCGSENDRDANAAKNIHDIAFHKQNITHIVESSKRNVGKDIPELTLGEIASCSRRTKKRQR